MLKCSNKNNNAKSKLATGSCYNYTATKMRRSMLKCSNKKNNENIFVSWRLLLTQILRIAVDFQQAQLTVEL